MTQENNTISSTILRNASLEELATELKREDALKRDFIVPSSAVSMQNGLIVISNAPSKTQNELNRIFANSKISNRIEDRESIALRPLEVCHSKLAEKLGIPSDYYKKIREKIPALLDANVSAWFGYKPEAVGNKKPKQRNFFVRTFAPTNGQKHGIVRTFASDRFKVIDNYDILMTALKAIKESGADVKINKCDITDKKFYMRVFSPEIEMRAKDLLLRYRNPLTGESASKTSFGVQSGFVISNSEIGYGGFTISPRAIILVCTNGLTRPEDTFKKIHLGEKMDENSTIQWSEKTKIKNFELIDEQIKDAVKHFLSLDYLGSVIDELSEYSERELDYPVDATQNVCSAMKLTEKEQNEVLRYFTKSGDTSYFGVTQALTYFAHETSDADLQFQLESEVFRTLRNMENRYDKPSDQFKKSKKNQIVEAVIEEED